MTNLKQMAEKAMKKGQARKITPVYKSWDKEGDVLCGIYRGRAEVTGHFGGNGYNQYLFESDEGLIKCSLGKASDNEFKDLFIPDHLYVITYLGKQKISGGRQVNKFDVVDCGFVEELNAEEK